MSERAKLKYKDLSFYDEDLKKLCAYVCQASGLEFLDYKIDRETKSIWYQYRRHLEVDVDCLSFDELANLRIPLIHEKPVIDYEFRGKKYVFYRKDIWELEDLLGSYFKVSIKCHRLDNYAKHLYIYFGLSTEKFIGMSFEHVGDIIGALKTGASYDDIKKFYRTWGNIDKG
jgi:hypothetical protein